MTDEVVCGICGKSKQWHDENHPWHNFTLNGNLSKRSLDDERVPSSQGATEALLRGDPILRMALIRKGVITPEDLDQVEAEVRATGISHS